MSDEIYMLRSNSMENGPHPWWWRLWLKILRTFGLGDE